jgi:transposase
MPNPLVVGVDVHRQTNTVCLMDQAGQLLGPRLTIDNNRVGAQRLVDHLTQKMAQGDFDAIQIAAEATSYYWWHFFQTLSRDPVLRRWPLQLYPLNPRLTANFAKTYVDRDHTDLNDAFVIADRLRLGRDLPPPYQLDARYLALRLLTRYRFHIVHVLAREKAYALAILYLKASEYGRLKPFANLFGAASRAVLEEFASLEAIAELPFDELVEWLDVQGIGPVFAGGIVAENGDVARFDYDQAKVAKFAGFKWKKHQSGDFTAEETRLSGTGNRYLRYYFCEAANAVRMHDREYGAYYDRKYGEVPQHQHKRAIVLTARKLVRLVVRLLTTNQAYQPRRPATS